MISGHNICTGAGGDNGTGKISKRREILVSSHNDQSHYLHPHPYVCACARSQRTGSLTRLMSGSHGLSMGHLPWLCKALFSVLIASPTILQSERLNVAASARA
jgi:hypothetical protein